MHVGFLCSSIQLLTAPLLLLYAWAMQVVSFLRANKDELYTLSAEGVNQYRNNIHTEFTALDQWQREVSLFASLKKLKTFQQYKLWKGFR